MSDSSKNGAISTENSTESAPSADTSLETQLAQAKADAEKFKNEYLYLRADFENYKKNSIKERSEYLRYGSERLIVELLGVFDNFERALETPVTPDNFKEFAKGIEMTATELRAVLKRFGVTDLAAHGLAFDPTLHEALGSEESSTVPAGHVVRVFKKPYKLHDKLIRPAQVVVAKSKSDV